jgi:hypothetical protein
MFPPANDLIALLGINLVLSAGCLRLLSWRHGSTPWTKVVTAAVFALLWYPVGPARLPLVAYVRGISSDLSISLVAIACLGMYQRLRGLPLAAPGERMLVNLAFAAAALFLYPLALGWGDWDAYRLGWGSWPLWAALLVLSLACWAKGFRLLPALLALALLAWVAGALESTNLWDYLMDPWLAVAAIYQCIKSAIGWGHARLRGTNRGAMPPSA